MEQMKQIVTPPFKAFGNKGCDFFDGPDLATEAWGERANEKNSGIIAFAYLWRRFGPPWRGGDNHKSLVDYVLTTNDEHVFLWMNPCGSKLALCVGHFVHESIRDEIDRPIREWNEKFHEWWWTQHPEFQDWEDSEENKKKVSKLYWKERCEDGWIARAKTAIGETPPCPDHTTWREDDGVAGRVNRALFDALKELERPVYVRDCPINIFGRCDELEGVEGCEPAEVSEYAGYGVPKEAMDELIKEER